MPGARNRNFRFGDSAELLAQFILSRLAFTTPVPRQEDVGHDFLCSVIEQRDTLLLAGPVCFVQVKSNRRRIVYSKQHELEWLRSQENPLFIGVSRLRDLTLDLYSTWNILRGVLFRECRRVELVPGGPNDDCLDPTTAADGSKQVIPLGKPALSVNVEDAVSQPRASRLAGLLREWILFDRANIVNQATGMYWVAGPERYSTNESPAGAKGKSIGFYWNRKNLPRCELNFGRAATALRLVLRRVLGPEDESDPTRGAAIQALNEALRANSNTLEPLSVRLLRTQTGLSLTTRMTTSHLSGLTKG